MEIPDFAKFRWTTYLLRRQTTEEEKTQGQGNRLLYVGITNNIEKRLREHNAGKSRSTRGGQWELIGLAVAKAKDDAVVMERWLKCGDSRDKRNLFAAAFNPGATYDGVNQAYLLNRAKCWDAERAVRAGFGISAGGATKAAAKEDQEAHHAKR